MTGYPLAFWMDRTWFHEWPKPHRTNSKTPRVQASSRLGYRLDLVNLVPLSFSCMCSTALLRRPYQSQ